MKAEQPDRLEKLEHLVDSSKGELSIQFGRMSFQDHPSFLQAYNQRMQEPRADFQHRLKALSD